jgi:hypothetical protein
MIITQAVYGYPQIHAQSLATVNSWRADGNSNNLLDSIGIMVYKDTDSLNWVAEYTGEKSSVHWCALCSNAKVPNLSCKVPK